MSKTKKNIIINIVLIAIIITETILFICLPNWSGETVNQIVPEVEEVAPGKIRGTVLTDNGSLSNAAIIIEDENGKIRREPLNFLSGYNIDLAPGKYKLTYTRGVEFSEVTKEIEVKEYGILNLPTVRLLRLYDSYSKGWVAGDLHQHTSYSDGKNLVDNVFLSNINNGLYYGFLSDHNSALGLSEWTNGKNYIAYTDSDGNERKFNPYEANEVTTEFGHYQALGVGLTFDKYEVTLRDSERYLPQAQKKELIKERIKYIATEIKRAGGVAQINHPYSSTNMGFKYWDIAEYFDTIEIWNGYFVPGDGRYEGNNLQQNYKSKLKWFELLNEVKNGGKFFAATGGTDNHEIEGEYQKEEGFDYTNIKNMDDYKKAFLYSGKYTGQPSTYIHVPDVMENGLTLDKTLDAIKKGHSFISNGPIVLADINGVGYGDTVTLNNAQANLNIEAFCRDKLNQIKIIKNGEVMQTIDVNDINFDGTVTLSGLQSGDWIVLEGLGTDINYAITNPIFIK